MQTLAASHDACDASSLAMFASGPHGNPASNRAAALWRTRSAASTCAYASRYRKLHTLIGADGPVEHHPLVCSCDRPFDEPPSVPDALPRD